MDGPILEVRMFLHRARIRPTDGDKRLSEVHRENLMRLQKQSVLLRVSFCSLCVLGSLVSAPFSDGQGLSSRDLSRLRSVGAVEISPDARRIAYSVTMRDRPGRP